MGYGYKAKTALVLALGLLPLLFAACSTPRIVNRPAVDEVQEVGVVSVTANRGIHSLDEGGGTVGGLMAAASMVTGGEEDEGDDGSADFGGHKLVNRAVDIYTEEFNQVDGWRAVHPDEFMDSSAFVRFREDMQTMADEQAGGAVGMLGSANLKAAEGMPRIPLATEAVQQRMAELAGELDLDAVAVVYLDVAYETSVAVGGTGTAVANVGHTLTVYNGGGEIAVNTTQRAEALRASSDDSTPMAAGEIIYNEDVEAMFLQSIRNGAARVRGIINTDLAET